MQILTRWVQIPAMAAADDLRGVLGDTFTYGEARKAAVSDKRLYRLRDSG